MTFPDANLTAFDFTESSGNNAVTILEPLFDQLVKKALANTM